MKAASGTEMPFAAFIVFAEGHKERYVGSLFRVDEHADDVEV